MGVVGAGPAVCETLVARGLDTVEKIITDLSLPMCVAWFGRSGEKMYMSLCERLHSKVELETFADASGCFPSGIGTRKIKAVSEGLGRSFFDISLKPKDIVSLSGFDDITAGKFIKGLKAFNEFYVGCYEYFVPKKILVEGTNLDGMVFEFTKVRDKQMEDRIVSLGGKIGSKFTHLIVLDKTVETTKTKKALKNGAVIMDISEARNFLEMN